MIYFNFPDVKSERMSLIEDWTENCSCFLFFLLVGLSVEVLIVLQNQRISGSRIESVLDFSREYSTEVWVGNRSAEILVDLLSPWGNQTVLGELESPVSHLPSKSPMVFIFVGSTYTVLYGRSLPLFILAVLLIY